jgi:gliding motility-associated-like protein
MNYENMTIDYFIKPNLTKRFPLLMSLCLFSFYQAFAQCGSLELITNSTSQCQPAMFKWVIKNAPTGSTYTWNYGFGTQKGQDTLYPYINTSGKISVSVQVKFPDKTVCTISKPNFVEVYPKPVPKFYASRKILCDGADTVTYFDITDNSDKRSWVIDGTNYFNANKKQTHAYSSTGIKKLSLVIENKNGCRSIKEFDSIAIIHKDVILDFTSDKPTGCIVKSMLFTPKIQSNGLKLLSYKWEFPGGIPNIETKQFPDSIYFSSVGIFSPSLTVVAENGCVHKLVKQNYISLGLIDSINLKISDTSICRGKTIIIENLNKTAPGKFTWKLNGTTSINKPDQYTCKARYDTLGKYNISVEYDYNGCKLSKYLPLAIRVKGVKANYSSTDFYHCALPHTVHFKNLSESYEPGKMIYQWRYTSDGVFLKSSPTIHDSIKLKQQGFIDVTLITRHSNGCVDTFSTKKFIRNKEIMPEFGSDFPIGCPNQSILFNQNTPPSSYKAPDKFIWTFYDKDDSTILGTSTAVSPSFSYKDTGLYSVKMIGYNGIGCRDSIAKRQFIEIVNPKLKFNVSNPILCINEILLGKANSDPKRARFNYDWLLENQNNGVQIHSVDSLLSTGFNYSGAYNFKITHEINKGCRDSFIDNSFIRVNGILGQLTLDTFNGCSPLLVKPSIKVIENYHFGNASNALKYKWSTTPAQNAIISNDTSINPEINFTLTGEYRINLEITNSTGCVYSLSSQTIYVGVRADMDVSDYTVCAGQTIFLNDKSSLNPTKIKWILTPEAITTDSLTQSQIKIQYKDDAEHLVRLVANKLDYCYDTVYRKIKSIIVKANFKAIETNLTCAPAYAQFESSSKYADSLRWDFGDNTKVTTTDPLVANIYQKNTGSLNGYTISLIAESNEGCSDSIKRLNYVKVNGPVPSFQLLNNTGCEPLNVEFKNTSNDVFKHYINYDDGSPLDSTFGKYIYHVTDSLVKKQVYKPRMYAIDSSGCKAEFISPDSVLVLQNSEASFSLSDSIICENQMTVIRNLSKDIIQTEFYLNLPGQGYTLLNDSNLSFAKKGQYGITQIVKNSNLCVDSLNIPLKVNPNPIADFAMVDSICQLKELNFKDKSTGEFAISNYWWEVSNPSNPVIFTTPNIKYTFLNHGLAQVTLKIQDINLCESLKQLVINVPNPADIPSGDLKSISVNFDSTVQVISNSNNYSRFMFGTFYKTSNNESIRKTVSKLEEFFNYDNNHKIDSSLCIDYRYTDICGYESKIGNKHCTMVLKVMDDKPFTNLLVWTPYIGWSDIDNYTIYRKKQGEKNYKILTTLPSSYVSYLDSDLCHIEYTYYIKANFNNLESNSNTGTNMPKFIFPPTYTDVKNVTVLDNNTIQVSWLPNNNTNFYNYELKRTNVQTYQTEVIYTITPNYIDKDVNTSLYNYVYQVTETDKCGFRSMSLYEGKNMVLNATSEEYKSFTNWDTYKSWRSGVKEYRLQVEKEGNFKTIYTTTNVDSAFVHDQTFERIHGPYCYRIMAISGDEKDTSFSNISCIVSPSTLFIPNAFSPNGDGVNEKISVRSLFVYDNTHLSGRNFTLEIFNRWGERVYLSHDIDGEWDGIYMGKLVQTGVYSFRLKAMGIDNKSYSMKGVITIVP